MGQATTTFDEYDYLYAVFIEVGNQRVKHDVMAKSDCQETTKVWKEPGYRPFTECDIVGPLPNGFCYSFPV